MHKEAVIYRVLIFIYLCL